LLLVLAEVLGHDRGIAFVESVCRVDNVVVQHDILEIFEESYIFLLPDVVYDPLVLCQDIVKHDLLCQNVDYFIIVDAMRAVVDHAVLNKAESFLKGDFNSIEDVASLIKHGLSFLHKHIKVQFCDFWGRIQ
jgi:hypothetical protein